MDGISVLQTLSVWKLDNKSMSKTCRSKTYIAIDFDIRNDVVSVSTE